MLTDDEIVAIRDELLPSQGESFDCIAFARAILAQAQTWHSMESAPKDGTAVLLCNAGGSWIARYEPVYPSGYRPENPWFSLMLNRDYMKRNYAPPTHWMPLPLPPTDAAKEAGNG